MQRVGSMIIAVPETPSPGAGEAVSLVTNWTREATASFGEI